MDPNVTLARIIDAAASGDERTLREAAEELAWWLKVGGFTPADPRI